MLTCMTIQMKAIEQYFHVVLFIMMYKVVLTFKSETLVCDCWNESRIEYSFYVVLFIMLCKVVPNFKSGNPSVWPFKWKISSRGFKCCYFQYLKKQLKISLLSPSRFVKILDDYIEKGGEFSKSTSNIAVHRELVKDTFRGIHLTVQTSKDKIAINATVNSTSGEDEASVTIPRSVLNSTDNTTLIVVYYRTSVLFAPEYRRTEVCEDSFTTEKVSKVERSPPSSRYTMENSSGDVVTESSPVLAASLRKKHVANLSSPIIIKFQMPRDQVSYKGWERLLSFWREKPGSHCQCTRM